MRFVLLVYQGSTPRPGSDGWQTLPEAEQKATQADDAELDKTEDVASRSARSPRATIIPRELEALGEGCRVVGVVTSH